MNDLPFVTIEDQRELAATARHGGRLITSAVARFVEDLGTPGRYQTWVRDALRGDNGPDAVRQLWATHIESAGGNGAKGWMWEAERHAGIGRFGRFNGPQDPETYAVLLKDAEAMVGWPIYRAAILAPVADILFEDGPDTQWDSSTADRIAKVIR